MTDSHEVSSGVNEQRVIKFCAKGHLVSSRSPQASTWLQRCPIASRRHLGLVRFQDRTAAARRKPIPKFTPHWTPSTSGRGLPPWWTKATSSPMAKRTPLKMIALKSKTTSPTPQGTTKRSLTNTRGDTNTKFRPNIINLTEISGSVIISELDINFKNLKRIALTTSHYHYLHQRNAKISSMLTNLCLCKSIIATSTHSMT